MNVFLKMLISFCLFIIGSSIFIILNFSSFGIILGVIFLILAFFILIFPSKKKEEQIKIKPRDRILMIPDATDVTINSLYEKFKDIDTHYGAPWISKMDLAPGKSLIFGPTGGGDYIYIYKASYGSNLYVAENDNPKFLKPLQKDVWRLIPHKSENEFNYPIAMKMASITVFEDIYNSLKSYVQKNTPTKILTEENKNSVFIVHNDLLTFKPRYTVTDLQDKPYFDINKLPQAFNVCLYNSSEELLRCIKLPDVSTPHYDLYKNNNLFFSFTKKSNLDKGHFSVDTPEGKITIQDIPDRVGHKYIVKLDHVIIGTIADKLVTPTETILHYVVHSRNEKYSPLLIALTVIVVREFNLEQ